MPSAIAPRSWEWALAKTRASAFGGTPLSVYLTRERVDSVVISGGLTSACVCATAVDACLNGYDTFVIDELAEKWRHA